jgi:hypothetical protein
MEAPFRRTVGNTIECPAGVATRPAFLQTPLALPTWAVDPPSSHSHIRIII